MLLDFLFGKRLNQDDVQDDPNAWLTGGARTSAGQRVSQDRALNYSAVWAATRILSGTGACLPLNVYQRLPGGGKRVASEHALQSLVHDAPNEEMCSMMWRSSSIAQQVNRGNCFAEIERLAINGFATGPIVALWPIHASRVEVKRRKDQRASVYYLVKNNDGSKLEFPARDILHIPSMMSHDGVIGIGVIENARESIGLGLATETHGATFFGNGAHPGVVVKHPGKLSPEARTNFRREWNEIHQGPHNAHKVALLQEGADLTKYGVTPEDSQFLQTRQFNVNEIARWYGLPPHLIGDLTKSSFNNIEVQGVEFVVYSLLPWLKLWEQECNRKLLTKQERRQYYIKHVVDALLRGDTASRTSALQTQFMNGAITLDEWREIEDRNPIPGGLGKKHYVPLNLAPLGESSPTTQPPAMPPEKSPSSETPESNPVPERPLPVPSRNGASKRRVPQTNRFQTISRSLAASVAAKLESKRRELFESLRQDALEPIQETLTRLAAKERNEIARAAKNSKKFPEWMDAFYDKHESTLADALTAPCAVWAAMTNQDKTTLAKSLAAGWVSHSRQWLNFAIDEFTPKQFAGSVQSEISAWPEQRPADLIETVLLSEDCYAAAHS